MKKSPLVGISLRNGAIAGVLAAGLLIVLFYIGRHPMLIMPYADFRVLLFGIFIFFTLKEFRDSYQEGVLHFFQGMAGSFIMVMTAAVLSALLVWFFSAIQPDFITEFVKQGLASAKLQFEQASTEAEKTGLRVILDSIPATNGRSMAKQHFAQSLIIGLFVSIILSIILRKQPKPI